jgi:hypothetical protein
MPPSAGPMKHLSEQENAISDCLRSKKLENMMPQVKMRGEVVKRK